MMSLWPRRRARSTSVGTTVLAITATLLVLCGVLTGAAAAQAALRATPATVVPRRRLDDAAGLSAAIAGIPDRVAEGAAYPASSMLEQARAHAAELIVRARREEVERLERAIAAAKASPCGKQCPDTIKTTDVFDAATLATSTAGKRCGPGGKCSGHGSCNGVCDCDDGYSGPSCATAVDASALANPASLLTIVVGYAECAVTSEVLKAWADQGVQITKLDGAVSGSSLNTLIFGVTTPYAMVLVDGMVPSQGVGPASVVQAMQQSNLNVAGGLVEVDGDSTKFDGRLINTCHAVRVRNYTVDHTFGYRQERRGCMLCNAVSESFVVDVAAFKRIKGFADKVKGSAYPIVAELFVRLHRQRDATVGSCPTRIQFRHVKACAKDDRFGQSNFKPTANTNGGLSYWHLPDTTKAEEVINCCCGNSKGRGNLCMGPCKYDDMAELFFVLFDALKAVGLNSCVAGGGQALTVQKFQRLLPWDYDLDVYCWITKWSQLTQTILVDLAKELQKHNVKVRYKRTTCAATVFALKRSGFDIDLYVTGVSSDMGSTRNPKDASKDLKSYAHDDCRKIWNEVTPMGPHVGWRNIVPLPGTEVRDRKWTIAPLSTMLAHGRWVPVPGYNWPHNVQKYGPEALLFHVTRALASVEDMMEGKNYGSRSLTRDTKRCAGTGAAANTGCLDGWVWFEDWLEWQTEEDKTPW